MITDTFPFLQLRDVIRSHGQVRATAHLLCLASVMSWERVNRLKYNLGKTEVLYVSEMIAQGTGTIPVLNSSRKLRWQLGCVLELIPDLGCRALGSGQEAICRIIT